MKRITPAAVLIALLATAAAADNFSARALLSYQKYGYGSTSTAGFRQTYDLRLDKVLTTTSIVRLFFRGDDFRGTETSPLVSRDTGSRLLQPGAELALNLETMRIQARSEVLDTRSTLGDRTYGRRLDRTSGLFDWTPDALPSVRVVGQRMKTTDDAAQLALTEESAVGQAQYTRGGWQFTGQEQYSHSADPRAGFDRKSTMHTGDVLYSGARHDGKLTYTAEANAQLTHLDESAPSNRPTSVPTPVAINRVFYTIDDTPLDDRDHPAAPYPALNDGDLNTATAISIGPDGVSFQNFILDIGRIDRADEIRVVVRDAAGNPLRNGGGSVLWDVYTSQDGVIWTPIAGDTTYSAPLSLYSITFTQTTGRWLKAVNFGANVDPTFVTEIQAYYHTEIVAGERRQGTQNAYNATTTISVHPIDRFTFTYSGLYSSIRQELSSRPLITTRDIEHLGSLQYDLTKRWTVRTELLKRDVQTFNGVDDGATGFTGYLDYTPTRQLRTSLEIGKQEQTLDGTPFTLDTRALHVTAFVLRSLSVMLDAGTQTQTISTDGSTAQREFVNLSSNAQLTRRLRLLLTGSIQQTTTDSTDPAVALLGPQRDNRLTGDFIWRTGRELTLGVRLGYVSGQALSGFTQRYRAEWYPFADGTVSLGGAYEQDIDPTLNRKATRAIFNPRWLINRYATFDLNYTAVTTQFQSNTARQRSLFATLTLYR